MSQAAGMKRLERIEARYRVAPDAPTEERDRAREWVMTPADRRAWTALVVKLKAIHGHYPDPERFTLDALEPADADTALRIMARAYVALGWPISAEYQHDAEGNE